MALISSHYDSLVTELSLCDSRSRRNQFFLSLATHRKMGQIDFTMTWMPLMPRDHNGNTESCIWVKLLSHFGHIRVMVLAGYKENYSKNFINNFCACHSSVTYLFNRFLSSGFISEDA